MNLSDTLKRTRQNQLDILTKNNEDYLEEMVPFNIGDPVKFFQQPPQTLGNANIPIRYNERCGIVTEIIEVGGVPGSGNFWANVKVIWKLKTGRISIPVTRFWCEDPSGSTVEIMK